VTRGASTARVVADALRRRHDVHARTGAVEWFGDDRALADAAAVDRAGPAIPATALRGRPITVMDWIDVTGFPCAGGFPEHRDRHPTADASVVARLRAAGAIVAA
jgi:Asp-tRNA(Asn)/Glu-tRNA(Gln) amidotransferase A subunit family amidase